LFKKGDIVLYHYSPAEEAECTVPFHDHSTHEPDPAIVIKVRPHQFGLGRHGYVIAVIAPGLVITRNDVKNEIVEGEGWVEGR
jgi:hypothetical protein